MSAGFWLKPRCGWGRGASRSLLEGPEVGLHSCLHKPRGAALMGAPSPLH